MKQWLFNFAASPAAGGVRRLIETAKWFAANGGATFLIHPSAVSQLNTDSRDANRYIVVQRSKISRLWDDSRPLRIALEKYGRPDFYFSQGIPLNFAVGKLNWLHICNALTLERQNIVMPLKRRLELTLLNSRLLRSIPYIQTISGESQFTVDLIRRKIGDSAQPSLVVLRNGFDVPPAITHSESFQTNRRYAISVGTYSYKRLDIVYDVFRALTQSEGLEELVLVGDTDLVPKQIRNDPRVRLTGTVARDEVFKLMRGSRCFISASQIENSSNAVLEAMYLCPEVILSNIPAHREMFNAEPPYWSLSGRSFLRICAEQRASYVPEKWPSWPEIVALLAATQI